MSPHLVQNLVGERKPGSIQRSGVWGFDTQPRLESRHRRLNVGQRGAQSKTQR
jgi:hypothetical protein